MRLLEVAPRVKVDDVLDRMGFKLIVPTDVKTMKEPTSEGLKILREVDPKGLFLGREVEE